MGDPIFSGACPALITPFTTTGAIDYDKMAQLLERQVIAGSPAVCVAGTTGEGSTLSLREHISLVSFCRERTPSSVKLIAGAGKNDTATALYLSQRLEEVGADGLLHVTPYYNKASQAGLVQHFESIANRVTLPIILYNVPTRTGLSFTVNSYQVLSQIPNIVGVKEASGDFSLVLQTISLCGDDFYIWSGNDDQVVAMMALGAKGVISVLGNLVPEVVVSMTNHCINGNFQAARSLQIKYAQLARALFLEVNPIPIKTAMNLIGLEVGGFRPPMCPLGVEALLHLRQSMEQVNLLHE